MHEADWVHRDVSAGNVYRYKDEEGERGLLADFEYAKKMKKNLGEHEAITVSLAAHIAMLNTDTSNV